MSFLYRFTFQVYRSLLELLPNFGAHNWTSEMRGEFKHLGLEPYTGDSRADFRYEDTKGALTRHIYGKSRKTAWHPKWPTYHLEVKTTSETEKEKFYMSKLQCEHVSACGYALLCLLTYIQASQLSIREPGKIPTDIYVLIRVWNIRDRPAWKFYADPHSLVYDGRLRIVSEVAIQVVSHPQKGSLDCEAVAVKNV
jgi:hypothetical protein